MFALRRIVAAAATLALAGALAACGGSGDSGDGPVTLRLGYFPNLTHATPIVGVADGLYS